MGEGRVLYVSRTDILCEKDGYCMGEGRVLYVNRIVIGEYDGYCM